MALLSIKDCGKPVRQLWLDFSKKAPNWQDGAAEQWWNLMPVSNRTKEARRAYSAKRRLDLRIVLNRKSDESVAR